LLVHACFGAENIPVTTSISAILDSRPPWIGGMLIPDGQFHSIASGFGRINALATIVLVTRKVSAVSIDCTKKTKIFQCTSHDDDELQRQQRKI
jgi:hypothetical protein